MVTCCFSLLAASFWGEFIGTMLLVVLGNGVCANVLLNQSKGQNGGWIVIATGWACAVFVAVACVNDISGAHINPAVSIALAMTGAFSWSLVPSYLIAQLLGAMVGSMVVWLAYFPHWSATTDALTKRNAFCTSPAIRMLPANMISEIIGTFVLILGILLNKSVFEKDLSGSLIPIDLGALAALPVAILVWSIGLSLGGPTGYAINPARDLGPRIVHFLLPIKGKGSSDWTYAWIPLIGPLLGAVLAVIVYRLLAN